MTKNEGSGSLDPTKSSQVNGRIYDVVTEINNKVKNLKKITGDTNKIGLISPEERVWIQEFLRSGDIRQASYAAYGDYIKNKMHARNMGMLKLEKPMIQKAIHELANEGGLSDERLLQKLDEMIYTSPNPSDVKGFMDMAFKVKGTYAPEKRITAGVTKDYSGYDLEEFEREALDLLEDGDKPGEEDILDTIALRDGEETGAAGL